MMNISHTKVTLTTCSNNQEWGRLILQSSNNEHLAIHFRRWPLLCFIFQCTLMASCFLSLITYTMWSNSWAIKFCLEWPPTSLDSWIFIVQHSSCSFNIHHPMSTFCFVVQHPLVVTQLQSFVLLRLTIYNLSQSPNLQASSNVEIIFYHNFSQCSNFQTCYLKL
jgi:hypothetical protein